MLPGVSAQKPALPEFSQHELSTTKLEVASGLDEDAFAGAFLGRLKDSIYLMAGNIDLRRDTGPAP